MIAPKKNTNLWKFILFHLMWNTLSLFMLFLIGNFGVSSIAYPTLKGLSVAEATLTRAPLDIIMWVVMLITGTAMLAYAFKSISYIYGTDMKGLARQIRARDGNESPSMVFEGYGTGLAIMFTKVALIGFYSTPWLILLRFFLYNLGVVLLGILASRRFAGIKNTVDWQIEMRESGTDGPSRIQKLVCIMTGGIGFLLP